MLRSTRAALAVGLGCMGVVGLVGGRLMAQQDPKVRQVAAAGTNGATAPAPMPALAVGTIDIEAVFKNYDKVKFSSEMLSGEAQLKMVELQKLATEGKQEQEKHERMAPNGPDAKKCEERMVQLKAQIEAGRTNAEREFTQKETLMMVDLYNEIAEMAKAVANKRGMTVVLKYNDGKVASNEPNSALAAMSKSIIYADPRYDITVDVTKYLNHMYKNNGGLAPKANAAPTQPAARPGAAAAAGAAGR